MKKTRLAAGYSYDFTLLGVSSSASEYKLAWTINQAIGTGLTKQKDMDIEFLNNDKLIISNFLHQTENAAIRLLRNKSFNEDGQGHSIYLVPELKNFDYFIHINDDAGTYDAQEIVARLSQLEIVSFAACLDVGKLKSKENLIFE